MSRLPVVPPMLPPSASFEARHYTNGVHLHESHCTSFLHGHPAIFEPSVGVLPRISTVYGDSKVKEMKVVSILLSSINKTILFSVL